MIPCFCCPATFPSPPPEIHSLSNRWRCNVSFHLMRRHRTSTVWENTKSKMQIQHHKTENKLCFLSSTILNTLNQFYFANRVVHFPSLESFFVHLHIYNPVSIHSHDIVQHQSQLSISSFRPDHRSMLPTSKNKYPNKVLPVLQPPPANSTNKTTNKIQLHIGSEAPNLDKLLY